MVVPLDYYLITLYITSMYINIDISMGIQTAKEALDKFRPQAGLNPTNKSLIGLLELVLTKNNFQFNNQHYLQTIGCAMGTRVAPSFTNTHVGKFKDDHVYIISSMKIYLLAISGQHFPCVWQHGLEEFNNIF